MRRVARCIVTRVVSRVVASIVSRVELCHRGIVLARHDWLSRVLDMRRLFMASIHGRRTGVGLWLRSRARVGGEFAE